MATVFRAVKHEDIDEVFELANSAGIGITTLPKDKAKWFERIERSVASFNKTKGVPCDENYFFVLKE